MHGLVRMEGRAASSRRPNRATNLRTAAGSYKLASKMAKHRRSSLCLSMKIEKPHGMVGAVRPSQVISTPPICTGPV